MLRSGELNQRITIEENQGANDGLAGKKPRWVIVLRPWAKIETLTGREFTAAGAQQSEATHKITIRYPLSQTITTAHHVKWKGATLGIESIDDPNQKHESLVLMCKEIK